jgi:MOSC domain-containing protein YiiM
MTRRQGRLAAIWIKRFKGGPMDERRAARLIAGWGLEGNANQGGKRQVTILSSDAWNRVRDELGVHVEPAARRANLFVEGIELERSRGRTLLVGNVRIQIRGETRPCEQMERAHPGLRVTLGPDWRGGVYGEVLDDGDIAVGDAVRWRER